MKLQSVVRFNKAPVVHSAGFACLGGNDVITEKVSDHHPIIHDGVLFWNVMMQCGKRAGGRSFNNGFGLIESESDYLVRLKLVAQVIAEAVYRDTSIEVISLCEGPIKQEHVSALFYSLMKMPTMARFRMDGMFHKPDASSTNWGLLMLADANYNVTMIKDHVIEAFPKLANRFQLWKLQSRYKEKYIGLAHFPFSGDEYKTEKLSLSNSAEKYCGLIKMLMEEYRNDSFIFAADFNFNPYLISQWQDRVLDSVSNHNSILITEEGPVKSVTVDGILLSTKEKQTYQSLRPEANLIERLKSEYRFFLSQMNSCKLSGNGIKMQLKL